MRLKAQLRLHFVSNTESEPRARFWIVYMHAKGAMGMAHPYT